MGPRADSNRSLRLYFAIQYLTMNIPRHHLPSEGGEWEDIIFYGAKNRSRSARQDFLVYANSKCIPYREWAFHNLSLIGPPVHYAGKCNGVTGQTMNAIAIENGKGSNYYLYSGYRFCLVMENRREEGYITEKIIDAFLGGCIPIYYGTREIFNLFNQDAFVYYDIDNSEEAIERILELERNHTAYQDVIGQPVLADGALENYFSYRDNIGGGVIKHRIRNMLDMH